MGDADKTEQSRFEPIAKPEFEPSVPEHILDGLTKKDRHVTESLSIIQQQNAWLISNLMLLSRHVRDLDLRLQQVEDWRRSLIQRSVTAMANTVIAPLLVGILSSILSWYVLKHIKP